VNGLARRQSQGVTLIELMFAIAIIGVITSIALPSYSEYQKRAKIATAVSDMVQIEQTLEKYTFVQFAYPNALPDTGFSRLDPWGNAYEYLLFSSVKGKGKNRKDKNLVPLNTDYDLYSKGADGETKGPISAGVSQDDIIRAFDGAFIGLATDF
jgi:general secretion pathway protein G